MKKIQQLFQSEDGNIEQREHFLSLLEKIVSSLDELKNPKTKIFRRPAWLVVWRTLS